MDKRKSLINVSVSVVFRIALLVSTLIVRRLLIKYIGNEANGLDSLYTSIIGFLAIAELGIGSAITFCMYKPIVDGDKDKVAALYRLFTKLYLIIGGIILVAGCAIMPALPYLAKDYQNTDVNLYLTFGIMLFSVVLTYVFSAKTSLINAYKNNYITTAISSGGQVLQCAIQIIVIVYTRSYMWYLGCRILAVAVQWGITELVSRIRYGSVMAIKQKVDADTKKEVTKNVKAMFMHKIGNVLVNTADSMIISAFIGIVVLGKFSNYTVIMSAMTSVLHLCFTPLTSVIGHMYVEESKDDAKRYLSFFHTFNFILGMVFFLGYYAVIDDLIIVFFGKSELILARSISFVITLNSFIQFMRQSVMLFRDATGTFYNDRWKPLFEGALNVVLSILFVKVFPSQYNVVGVIVATIITNLFICHIIEPLVLYKHALNTTPKNYYILNYCYIAVFTACLFVLHYAMVDLSSGWSEFFANGFIAVGIALVPSIVAVLINKNFRHYMKVVLNRFRRKSVAPAAPEVAPAEEVTENVIDNSDESISEKAE